MKPLLVLVEPRLGPSLARTTVRLSSGGSGAAAGLGGFNWESALVRRPRFTIELLSPDLDGRTQVGRGDFTINLGRVRQADALNLYWPGAPVTVYDATALDLATAPIEFTGFVRSAPIDLETGHLTLNLEVNSQSLDKPVLTAEFTGGGGILGDPGFKGTLKPAGFGTVKNIEPVWFDATRNIGMVDGYANTVSIDALFEGSSAFGAKVADYADYATLAARIDDKTVAPGRWATCVAQGLVGLGAPPVAPITVDAVFGTNRAGALMRRIMETHAGIAVGSIDTAAFTSLDTVVNRAVHYWLNSQRQVRDLVEAIAASCNATPLVTFQGKYSVTRAFGGASIATINKQAPLATQRVTKWRALEPEVPTWRMKMIAERVASVQSFDQMLYADDIIDRGAYNAVTVYRQGNVVWNAAGAQYIFINAVPAAGQALPVLPATTNAYWERTKPAPAAGDLFYADGTSIQSLKPAEAGADVTITHTAAAITGQAATATNSNFSAVTGPTRPSDNAGTSGRFNLIAGSGAILVQGNRHEKSGGVHGTYDSGMVAAAQPGSAIISGIPILFTNGWSVGLGLDAKIAGAAVTDQRFAAQFSATVDGGQIHLYENGSHVINAVFVAPHSREFALAYDGKSFLGLYDGVVRVSWPAAENLTLFPKTLHLHVGNGFTDVLYGPYNQNNWSAVGGADRPENNASVGSNILPNAGLLNGTTGYAITAAPAGVTISTPTVNGKKYFRTTWATNTPGAAVQFTGPAVAIPSGVREISLSFELQISVAGTTLNTLAAFGSMLELLDVNGGVLASIGHGYSYLWYYNNPPSQMRTFRSKGAVPAGAVSVRWRGFLSGESQNHVELNGAVLTLGQPTAVPLFDYATQVGGAGAPEAFAVSGESLVGNSNFDQGTSGLDGWGPTVEGVGTLAVGGAGSNGPATRSLQLTGGAINAIGRAVQQDGSGQPRRIAIPGSGLSRRLYYSFWARGPAQATASLFMESSNSDYNYGGNQSSFVETLQGVAAGWVERKGYLDLSATAAALNVVRADLTQGPNAGTVEMTAIRLSLVEQSATLGADINANVRDSALSGVPLVPRADLRTSLGTAAAITGQAATATNSSFDAVTGATKPANNATSDMVLTKIGAAANTAVTGNTIKSLLGVDTFDTAAYGAPMFGACFAEADIIPTGATAPHTALALDDDTTSVTNPTQLAYASYNAGTGTVYLETGGVGTGGTNVTGLTGKMTLACDRVNVMLIIGGVVRLTRPAVAGLTGSAAIYPKFYAYTAGTTQTGNRAGAWTDNDFASTGGATRPENNATVGGRFDLNLYEPAADGGGLATRVAYRTALGTAAAITSQGALATLNAVNLDTQVTDTATYQRLPVVMKTKVDGIEANATLGALLDTNLRETAGGVIATRAAYRTDQGTSAAITGQSAWATYTTGDTPTTYAGRVTNLGTGGAFNSILNITARRLTYLKRADDVTDLTEAAAITSLGTASAIASQSPWATYNSGDTPTVYAARTSRLNSASGYASASFAANDGRSFSKIAESNASRDGVAVTFASTLPAVPKITFLPGGNTGTAGQNIQIVASGLTVSGFTMRAKTQSPTANATVTDTTGVTPGAGEPSKIVDRSNSGAPVDGKFRFNLSVTVGNVAPNEPGSIDVAIYVKQAGAWVQVGTGSATVTGTLTLDAYPGTVDFGVGGEFGASAIFADGTGTALNGLSSVVYTLGTVTETSLTPTGASDIPWLALLQ